ncbi:probable carbohydrate binding domain [Hahella chejuensis KCTC 2396]|uniref:Probable carbohydrate binding domain n=1 Tax=Hahella chejuensis (strain KCTC 2396) TaxID=349521 RepID=Q2SEV2_HAHCH|nr:carbohydrate-binding protein [Hahella chejuensis]ABC30822.1 probable carbohydrate binding domain [Hahella chejuensis KCTC 2396]
MHKKRFFTSSFAALCLFSAAVHGQSSSAHQEYLQFAQNDHGEVRLDDGRTLYYTVKSRSLENGVEVIRAQVDDPTLADFVDYSSFIITLDHTKQEMSGYLETGSGQFRLQRPLDKSENVFWRRIQPPKMEDRILKNLDTGFMGRLNQEAVGEKDASGRYVIDVFIGFSEQAAQDVGNINTEAQMYVETVNEALNNSQVEGVYLRLVGVGVSPHNPGVVTSVLQDGKEWFKDDIARYAPDLIGLVQRPTDAPGSAGGWGYVPGDIVVIGAPWPGAYRHEVGHNVGGMHCKSEGDTGYNYGFSVRQGRGTAQCGNDLSYYSSPLVMDDEGNVLGTTHSQDMARLWRERSAAMSANRIHTVPFPGEGGWPLTLQAEDYLQFSDTTAGNQGGAYRSDDVDIEATSDSGGGYNVGWISDGEWLAYSANIPAAGEYVISYRVASPSGGGRIQFEKQGGSPVYGGVDVPPTGGWGNWTTIQHTVNLPARPAKYCSGDEKRRLQP